MCIDKLEIPNTAKSVTIFKKLESDSIDFLFGQLPMIVDEIKSGDTDAIYFLRTLAQDDQAGLFNTEIQNLILDFYHQKSYRGKVSNKFQLDTKIFLIKKLPKRAKPTWPDFYKKYPGSGGQFKFSKICYSKDSKTAMFYRFYARSGIYIEFSLIIMENFNGDWKIKYLFDDPRLEIL